MAEVQTVVRSLGAEVTHVILIDEDEFVALCWPSPKFPFTGLFPPVATRCARILRGQAIVVMLPGTRVKCVQCRRLTGIEAQSEDSYRPIHKVVTDA